MTDTTDQLALTSAFMRPYVRKEGGMTDQIKRISKEAAIDIWKSQCAAFVKSFRNNCYRMGGP